MPGKLILVRHGQSIWNVENLFTGWHDVDLSDQGRREAAQAGRELLKEVGQLLKREDPYQHLRSTGARATSAPLLEDGWMDFITDESADSQLGAIEKAIRSAG